jgi:ArsR family transcriptional regulator, arsenate/arsenite/antimonite-responsive transcriptional repressor
VNRLTNIFKLFSDETRLRMLVLLYQEELCVCELSGILDIPQPRISQNLGKFRDMDLVVDSRKEKYVYYSLKKENQILMDILKNIIRHIHLYPKLVADRNGIGDKENYLSNCGNKCN